MINSFDIETYEENKKLIPYCISSIIEDEERVFYGEDCIDEFTNYLILIGLDKKKKKKKKIYIFSHNLTFDGSLLIQNIKKKDLKFNGLFFKGNIYSLELKFSNISVAFKCSYRFFPTKLEKAEFLLNTSKKIEFDHRKISKENFKKYENEVKEYCLNDSRLVIQIIKTYDVIISGFINKWWELSNSLPGISLKIFETVFNVKKIQLYSNIEDDFLFRSAYYGGRCEVFGNSKNNENIYHFDFTGMYAQVMLEDFNYGSYEIVQNPKEIVKNGFYFIEGFSSNEIPVMPHHSDKNSKLMFTNGYFRGLYWWEEIVLFLETGGKILKIEFWLKFKKNGKIFYNFVETFSKMRKVGKSYNTVCKLIVNSIYGRLGMSEVMSETRLFNKKNYLEFADKNEKIIIKENWINDLVFVEYFKEKKNNNINSNVMLAAAITSKARIKLYKGFMSVISGGGRLLYCDTDSIFAAFEKNVDNIKFGEIFFDTEKNDTKIKKAVFALPKAYSIVFQNGKTVTKIKGFNNLKINFEEFKEMFESGNKKMIKIETLKKSNFIISPENVEKLIYLGDYTKRKFSKDFTSTTPFFKKENGELVEKQKINNELDYEFENMCTTLNLKKKKLKIKEIENDGKILKILETEVEINKDSIILNLMNTKENWYEQALLIKMILDLGLSSDDFKSNNKSKILKNLIKKNVLFYNIEFKGEVEKLTKYLLEIKEDFY